MKRKYKIMLLILIIVLIVCSGTWLSFIIRANIMYGVDHCSGRHISIPAFSEEDGVSWKCKLCGKEVVIYSDYDRVELCDRCASIMNRCTVCGKLRK